MDENIKIALIICCIFIFIIAILPTNFHGRGYDYYFHYAKAKGMEQYYDTLGRSTETVNYPPLFSWFTKLFSFREETFYFSSLIFLGLIIPISLVFLTRHWITALLYFSATSFFYFSETGIFAQATAIFLLILMLYFKKWYIRLALVFMSILAHSFGFYLAIIMITLIYFKETELFEKIYYKMIDLPFMPVACSGWFPEDRPNEILETEIIGGSSRGTSNALNLGRLTKFCVEIFPLPFAIMALYGFYFEKDWHLLIMFFIGILGGLFDYRIFFVSAVIGLIGLTNFYKRIITNSNFKFKLLFYAFTIIYAFIQFYIWFRLKYYCYPLWIVKPIL